MVWLVWMTMKIPQLLHDMALDVPDVQAVRLHRSSTFLSSCRGRSPWSWGPWRFRSCSWTRSLMSLLCSSCRYGFILRFWWLRHLQCRAGLAENISVFRAPRGTLSVMSATTVVQLPQVWVRIVILVGLVLLWCWVGFSKNTGYCSQDFKRLLPVMGSTTTVQLTPSSWVFACTSLRTGLRAIPSLSLFRPCLL